MWLLLPILLGSLAQGQSLPCSFPFFGSVKGSKPVTVATFMLHIVGEKATRVGWGRGQNLGNPRLFELGGPCSVSYLPILQLGKLEPQEGYDLSKATEGVSVRSPGDSQGRKNSIAYCLRLLVPVVAIWEAEENRMWEQR